ncbi:hypothetical protein ATK36_5813 [Amycolatopsis sulphurea]|uniref:Uncharacterized protein n=1 Tax=Amycolatopsis sulphurea TaxID=76022 RepID=A0A2A9FJ21_9PSEU|nr:hypothetical protein ATK36_5813 [Amycolatopsis sulphurea]
MEHPAADRPTQSPAASFRAGQRQTAPGRTAEPQAVFCRVRQRRVAAGKTVERLAEEDWAARPRAVHWAGRRRAVWVPTVECRAERPAASRAMQPRAALRRAGQRREAQCQMAERPAAEDRAAQPQAVQPQAALRTGRRRALQAQTVAYRATEGWAGYRPRSGREEADPRRRVPDRSPAARRGSRAGREPGPVGRQRVPQHRDSRTLPRATTSTVDNMGRCTVCRRERTEHHRGYKAHRRERTDPRRESREHRERTDPRRESRAHRRGHTDPHQDYRTHHRGRTERRCRAHIQARTEPQGHQVRTRRNPHSPDRTERHLARTA